MKKKLSSPSLYKIECYTFDDTGVIEFGYRNQTTGYLVNGVQITGNTLIVFENGSKKSQYIVNEPEKFKESLKIFPNGYKASNFIVEKIEKLITIQQKIEQLKEKFFRFYTFEDTGAIEFGQRDASGYLVNGVQVLGNKLSLYQNNKLVKEMTILYPDEFIKSLKEFDIKKYLSKSVGRFKNVCEVINGLVKKHQKAEVLEAKDIKLHGIFVEKLKHNSHFFNEEDFFEQDDIKKRLGCSFEGKYLELGTRTEKGVLKQGYQLVENMLDYFKDDKQVSFNLDDISLYEINKELVQKDKLTIEECYSILDNCIKKMVTQLCLDDIKRISQKNWFPFAINAATFSISEVSNQNLVLKGNLRNIGNDKQQNVGFVKAIRINMSQKAVCIQKGKLDQPGPNHFKVIKEVSFTDESDKVNGSKIFENIEKLLFLM